MGTLLERDVHSLHGIIKVFPSLSAPAPAAASGKSQQPNTGALEIPDLLAGMVPQEAGHADATPHGCRRHILCFVTKLRILGTVCVTEGPA